MSATFLTELFPDLAGALQGLPWLWDALFPADLQGAVPLPVAKLGPLQLIMPTLIPVALMGIAAGYKGCRDQRFSILFRRAFLFFALMNTSAIFCHSMIPYSSKLKPWVWGLDVGFTCVSSMFLVAGALCGRGSIYRDKLLQRYALQAPLPLILLAVYGNLEKLPWVNETMYIGTTLAAVATLLRCEVFGPRERKGGRGWIWGCALSALLAASGIPLDKTLCSSSLLRGHINHVHLLFAGCVGSFFSLERYLAANEAAVCTASIRRRRSLKSC